MRRTGLLLAIVLAMLGTLTPARAGNGVNNYLLGSSYCDKRKDFRGGPAIADGPASQIDVHTQVFEKAFAKACPRESGLLTFLGTGERSGVQAILDRNPDRHFGTADGPLSTDEWVRASADQAGPDRSSRVVPLHQIPLYVAVQAVAFNLRACGVKDLRLRSQVLSRVYSGVVTRWNDDLLVYDNPGLAACDYPIRVIKRADFAGSTAIFKDYLSRRNPEWAYYKQPAQNQLWPTVSNTCPALGEDGMADCIATTQHSIGYLSYHEARRARLTVAAVDSPASAAHPDASKRFIKPSAQGCTDAAAAAFVPPAVRPTAVAFYSTPSVSPTAGDWSTVSITDSPAGYPICFFGFAFVYELTATAYFGRSYSVNAARTIMDYLWTALTDPAQTRLPAYDYGLLPPNVLDVARAGLETIRWVT